MSENIQARPARKAGYRAATFRLPPDVLDELDEYSMRTGTVKGFIVEQALRAYFAPKAGAVQPDQNMNEKG